MSRRGGVGVWIFIFLLLIIVVIVGVVIFVKGKPEPVPSSWNESNVSVFFNVSLGCNAESVVNYELMNSSNQTFFSGGYLFPGALEVYTGGVLNGSNISLRAVGGDYYWNESWCNISVNDFKCRVGLKLKATGGAVYLFDDYFVVDNLGKGVFQSPLLFCFSWSNGFVNVLLPLKRVSVPSDLLRDWDLCYRYDSDVSNFTRFNFTLRRNGMVGGGGEVRVLVRDFEGNNLSGLSDLSTVRGVS